MLKTHDMWEDPPRGFRAYFFGTAVLPESVWLPVPIYWIAYLWRDFRIWKAIHFNAPLYRYNHRHRWAKVSSANRNVIWYFDYSIPEIPLGEIVPINYSNTSVLIHFEVSNDVFLLDAGTGRIHCRECGSSITAFAEHPKCMVSGAKLHRWVIDHQPGHERRKS